MNLEDKYEQINHILKGDLDNCIIDFHVKESLKSLIEENQKMLDEIYKSGAIINLQNDIIENLRLNNKKYKELYKKYKNKYNKLIEKGE